MSREPASIVLSHYQTSPLLAARRSGVRRCVSSIDLGISTVAANLDDAGVLFDGKRFLSWEAIEAIDESPNSCFRVEGDRLEKIAEFSELTGRPCSLMPTKNAPTMLIAGTLMHRVKNSDPLRDTEEKIKAVAPLVGRVLDTATGLGYTAMAAARSADEVVSVELDPAAREMARQNPWSQELFRHPKITLRMGDCFEVIGEFEAGRFRCILHDPPVLALAGQLYSLRFYEELARVLSTRGRLFHYIGNPDSRSGHQTTEGVIRRLRQAGFARIRRAPRAFGVVATR